MTLARLQADSTQKLPLTYFGDAEWDIKAYAELGVNLVIVGERVNHKQRIINFSALDKALSFVK